MNLLFQDMNLIFQDVNLLFQVMNLLFQDMNLLFQVMNLFLAWAWLAKAKGHSCHTKKSTLAKTFTGKNE